MVSTDVGVCSLQEGLIVQKGAGGWIVFVTTTPLITILAIIATVHSTVSRRLNLQLIPVTAVVEADVPQALLQETIGYILLVAPVEVLVGAGVQVGAVLAVEVDTHRCGQVPHFNMVFIGKDNTSDLLTALLCCLGAVNPLAHLLQRYTLIPSGTGQVGVCSEEIATVVIIITLSMAGLGFVYDSRVTRAADCIIVALQALLIDVACAATTSAQCSVLHAAELSTSVCVIECHTPALARSLKICAFVPALVPSPRIQTLITGVTGGLDGILRFHGNHKQGEEDYFHLIQFGNFDMKPELR